MFFTQSKPKDVKEKVCTNADKIAQHFALPISYCKKKMTLDAHIVNDLELVAGVDKESKSIYEHICAPSTCFGKKMLAEIPATYTTDKKYLKDTQKLLSKPLVSTNLLNPAEYQQCIDIYDEMKNDLGFKEKYYYLDWEQLLFLNKCEWFMQFMSIYNLSSPLLSLFLPIIMLIIPFCIIKMKGLELTVREYIDILKTIIGNHALGKLFTKFHESDAQQKIYLVMSAAFYVFSIYQNVHVCLRFYNNTTRIYSHLSHLQKYLSNTITQMREHISICDGLPTYSKFKENLRAKCDLLAQLESKLSAIDALHEPSLPFRALKQSGYVMSLFYELYEDPDLHDLLMYSFGFNGYLDVLCGIQEKLKAGQLRFCKFRKNGIAKKGKEKANRKGKDKDTDTHTEFTNAYYPALIGGTPVKNSYDLKHSLIITGPNASGKTTVLKSTLINVLTSQQFGCGCYESAKVEPYKYIHCYLNIPDTQGRDSLLQAEARRCKEIIDSVKRTSKESAHFCVFDELYSGTNPEEAITSAYAVMEYLTKHPNVSAVLTTHYVELCKKLEVNQRAKNFHMKVVKTGTDFDYTYKLEEGISVVKGGIKVLMDMDYPQEIIDNASGKKSKE